MARIYKQMPEEERKASIQASRAKHRAKQLAMNPNYERERSAKRRANPIYREREIARLAAWKIANPERLKEQTKRNNNSPKHRAAVKKYDIENPNRTRNWHYKTSYGITIADYESMAIAQNNRCAICRADSPGWKKRTWCVDHCHESKVVRGLLCHDCNTSLGKFKHDRAILQSAIDYLKKFSP
jgi:hypothetical protein